jgi:hypothetical protein
VSSGAGYEQSLRETFAFSNAFDMKSRD